jgi:hypothetical protein
MTEFLKIALTACLTILGGVIVYVIGQLLSKFLIEPTHELKKTIGEVRFNLALHAQVIHTPAARNPERSQSASEALLKSSCDLLARVNAIPFYGCLSRCSQGFLPHKRDIADAAKHLRGLTTYFGETGDQATKSIETIGKVVARIEAKLGLDPLE